MQVNALAGVTFESGLRALLRQDPDIIMVGETRDAETASISVRAAITGHLVFQRFIPMIPYPQSSGLWTWGWNRI